MSVLLLDNAIAVAAGCLITASSLPKLLDRFKDLQAGRTKFNRADATRDSMIALGNVLWVIFGVRNLVVSIILFCGLNAGLLSLLVYLNFRSRYRATRASVAAE